MKKKQVGASRCFEVDTLLARGLVRRLGGMRLQELESACACARPMVNRHNGSVVSQRRYCSNISTKTCYVPQLMTHW